MARKKQYVALRNYKADGYKFSKWEMVWMEEEEASTLVSQHTLMPYATAVNEGFWPPPEKVQESLDKKRLSLIQEAKEEEEKKEEEEEKPPAKPSSSIPKILLGNKLRAAVQKKKQAAKKPSRKVTAAKLAAIKAGGKA